MRLLLQSSKRKIQLPSSDVNTEFLPKTSIKLKKIQKFLYLPIDFSAILVYNYSVVLVQL